MSYTLHGVLEAKQVRSCSRRIVKLGHRRAALFFEAPWSSLLHSHVGLLRKQQRPNCDSALELEGLEGDWRYSAGRLVKKASKPAKPTVSTTIPAKPTSHGK